MSRQLLSWFEKRRKSKTLQIAQMQMMKCIETVNELNNAIKVASEGNEDEAFKCIERLFSQHAEIDDLRRSVFEELTKGDFPAAYREDLMHLVKRLDVMADHVKDSARCIRLLVGKKIPEKIWIANVNISNNLVECVVFLSSSIEMLGVNAVQAKELALKVDIVEGKIDDKWLTTKLLLINYASEMNSAILLILNDLLEYIEQAADMCADTADYIRLLAVKSF